MNVQKHCYMHTDPNYKCSSVKLKLGMTAECPLSGINLHPASSHNQVFNQGCLIILSEFRYLNCAYHLIPIVDLVLVHFFKKRININMCLKVHREVFQIMASVSEKPY